MRSDGSLEVHVKNFSDFGGSLVDSVFGRTGTVTAQVGDYSAFYQPLGTILNTFQPQGRLTLASGVASTVSDIAGATNVYYTPTIGRFVPLFDGSTWNITNTGGELVLPLDNNSGHTGYHQSGKNFDYYVYNDSGNIRLGTGPAWSTDISRGTGAGTTEVEILNGLPTNKNSMVLRFGSASGSTVTAAAHTALLVGSGRMTADGQTEDSAAKRFTNNAFNTIVSLLYRNDPTDSWNYLTATYRQWNATAANRVEVMRSFDVDLVSINIVAIMAQLSSSTARSGFFGIGLDVTNAKDAGNVGGIVNSSTAIGAVAALASWSGYPGLGYHALNLVEKGAGTADTQTWYGDVGLPADIRTGLTGFCVR